MAEDNEAGAEHGSGARRRATDALTNAVFVVESSGLLFLGDDDRGELRLIRCSLLYAFQPEADVVGCTIKLLLGLWGLPMPKCGFSFTHEGVSWLRARETSDFLSFLRNVSVVESHDKRSVSSIRSLETRCVDGVQPDVFCPPEYGVDESSGENGESDCSGFTTSFSITTRRNLKVLY